MNVTIELQVIKLWERKPIKLLGLELPGGLSVTNEYAEWNKLEATLLKVLSIMEKKGKLPANYSAIGQAMADSHARNSRAFTIRRQHATVVNINNLLEQLI